MATKNVVAGDLYYELDGQLTEIKRQLRQKDGYPYGPLALKRHLQAAIEGDFVGAKDAEFLELVATGIQVTTQSFVRDSFWTTSGTLALQLENNFAEWIVGAMPETIPAFQGAVRKTQLRTYFYDSEILEALGSPRPFSVKEVSAVLSALLLESDIMGATVPGMDRHNTNLFYVKLSEERVVVVIVELVPEYHVWRFDASILSNSNLRPRLRWDPGVCVFSRG